MDRTFTRALRLLGEWSQGHQAGPNRPAQSASGDKADETDKTDKTDKVVDELAGRLMAEELPRYAWLDVGVWGRSVYRASVSAALRVRRVAVTGDEYPL